MLQECPVSMVLRECPRAYEALAAAAHVENGGLNPMTLSAWAQEAIRVVGSERARHRDLKDRERRLTQDARESHRV